MCSPFPTFCPLWPDKQLEEKAHSSWWRRKRQQWQPPVCVLWSNSNTWHIYASPPTHPDLTPPPLVAHMIYSLKSRRQKLRNEISRKLHKQQEAGKNTRGGAGLAWDGGIEGIEPKGNIVNSGYKANTRYISARGWVGGWLCGCWVAGVGDPKNVNSTKVVILITFIASIWGKCSSSSSSKHNKKQKHDNKYRK